VFQFQVEPIVDAPTDTEAQHNIIAAFFAVKQT
jgi:hypothetical protein